MPPMHPVREWAVQGVRLPAPVEDSDADGAVPAGEVVGDELGTIDGLEWGE